MHLLFILVALQVEMSVPLFQLFVQQLIDACAVKENGKSWESPMISLENVR